MCVYVCVCCGFGPVLLSYDSVCLRVHVLQLHLTSLKGQDAITELVLRKVSLLPPTKLHPLSPFLPSLSCVVYDFPCSVLPLNSHPSPSCTIFASQLISQTNATFKGPLHTQVAAHVSRNGTERQELVLYTLTLLYMPFFHITKQL